MAVGDRFQLLDKQTLLGQQVLNRYYYRAASGALGNAARLAGAFINDVLPVLQTLQADALTHDSIEVINLDDPTDFIETVLTGESGDLVGVEMPPFVCWTYKLIRATREMRNGRKAIAGVTEEAQADGQPTAAFLTVLDAAAPIFAATIENSTQTDFYAPILARVDPTLGVTLEVTVADAEFSAISSQNSRKFGVGN